MNNSKQVKIGAILSYVSIAVNILAGLLYTPWMVKRIGQSQYGLYTLANSLITLFLIDFGLSSAAGRYVSKYHAEGDEEKVNNFLGVIYKLYLIIDTVIFVALFVFFFFIDKVYVTLTPEELKQFKVVYIIAASFAVFNFPFVTFNGVLTAYEKFIPLKLADLIYRFLIVGLTVVALLMGFGLYALVTVNAIAGISVIIFKFIVIKKTTPVKVNFRYSDKSLYKDIFGFSIWVTLASLAQRLIFNITPTILGVVADSSAIAVFGVVTTIEGYVYTVTTAINGMFMPKISRIYSNTDSDTDINPLFLRVGKFQYALNGLIVVGFALIGKSFINLWMGAEYSDAYYGILLVIIPGMFFNALQIANTAMVVQKKVNWQAWVNIAIGVLNVACSFLFSKYWGVIGASLSIFIAYMVRAIVLNIIFYKKMNFNIPLFARDCYLRMMLPMLITIGLGIGLNYLLADGGWFMFACKGCIIVVIYLVLMFFLGIKKDERTGLINWVKSIFHGRVKK